MSLLQLLHWRTLLFPIVTGFSTSSIFRDSPLVEIVVSSKDQLIQKSPNTFMDLDATSIREEHPEGSSDEEMEIIAHFIEHVEVTSTPDNVDNHNRPQSLMARTNSITQSSRGNSGDNFIKTVFFPFWICLLSCQKSHLLNKIMKLYVTCSSSNLEESTPSLLNLHPLHIQAGLQSIFQVSPLLFTDRSATNEDFS